MTAVCICKCMDCWIGRSYRCHDENERHDLVSMVTSLGLRDFVQETHTLFGLYMLELHAIWVCICQNCLIYQVVFVPVISFVLLDIRWDKVIFEGFHMCLQQISWYCTRISGIPSSCGFKKTHGCPLGFPVHPWNWQVEVHRIVPKNVDGPWSLFTVHC